MTLSLSLAGGGSKGIWQFGACQYLRDAGVQPDLLFGVSVGALNAGMIYQGDWDALEHIWMTVENEDIYTIPWVQVVYRLCNKQAALYDNAPLYKLLKKVCDRQKIASGKGKLFINASSYTTMTPYRKEIHEVPFEDIPTLLLASAAVPDFFPPVMYDGHTLVDGGLYDNFNISEAINQGADTIITINFATETSRDVTNILTSTGNMIEASFYGQYLRDTKATLRINQIIEQFGECGHKNVKLIDIKPSQPLDIDILKFEYKDRKALMQDGYNTARKALACIN